MQKKRIETATSKTAQWTCLSRAVSSLEINSCYKSDDFIAPLVLPGFARLLIRIPLLRKFFPMMVPAKGMYEYVIARTKYIDAVFGHVLADRFNQILIFGAGFDTRALRFGNKTGNTKIFELDIAATQAAKVGQYRKRGLRIPENVRFISIDFDKESLSNKLEESGFEKDRKNLFILEGILMYLQTESVHKTLQVIQTLAGKGSEIVFDYVYSSVVRNENLYEEERKIAGAVSKAGEQWQFGIEKDKIEDFLKTYDFKLAEHLDAHHLEQKYFKDGSGRIIGNINGTHCLVRAVKV